MASSLCDQCATTTTRCTGNLFGVMLMGASRASAEWANFSAAAWTPRFGQSPAVLLSMCRLRLFSDCFPLWWRCSQVRPFCDKLTEPPEVSCDCELTELDLVGAVHNDSAHGHCMRMFANTICRWVASCTPTATAVVAGGAVWVLRAAAMLRRVGRGEMEGGVCTCSCL